MPLGHRVGKDVMDGHAADQELAGTYRDVLDAATESENALRHAQGEGAPGAELRRLSLALQHALTDAVRVAEAAERAAMGPQTYVGEGANAKPARRDADIARRRAKARPDVRVWTDEVDRLRTARERHVLSFRVASAAATASAV
jgi:hypothetical protein